jgi:hypothetical protein
LLFLTDLKGYDVVLGKMAGGALAALQGLVATVPIAGCAIFLGGVTFGEIFRTAVALASLLFFSLAVGLWVSSRSRSASGALGGTLIALAVLVGGTLVFNFSSLGLLSPTGALFNASDYAYGTHQGVFWGSLPVTQVFAAFLLFFAAKSTHRFREDEPAKPAPQRIPRSLRGKMFETNPVVWLAGWQSGSTVIVWLLVALSIICMFFYPLGTSLAPASRGSALLAPFAVVLLTHYILKIFLAARASHCLAEARRNSTLELLLCTPLKVEDILRGQILSLKRKFLAPFLIVLVLEMIGVYWLLARTWGTSGPAGDFFGASLGIEVMFAIFFLVDMQSVAWTAIWFGLCSKNESAATFKTAAYVIVAPLFMLVLACAGMILFVLWPILAYYWARIQLQEHFRFLAGLRLASQGNITEWLPFHIPSLPPEPAHD